MPSPIFLRLAIPALAVSLLALLGTGAARADDQPFLSLDATDIEPELGHELEQNFVWASGKPGQSFNTLAGETELEYGYSDQFSSRALSNMTGRERAITPSSMRRP